MTDEPAELDLSCGVCAQSAVLTDVTPLRYEHAVTVWAATHAHALAELDAYRAAAERFHAAHDDDGVDG